MDVCLECHSPINLLLGSSLGSTWLMLDFLWSQGSEDLGELFCYMDHLVQESHTLQKQWPLKLTPRSSGLFSLSHLFLKISCFSRGSEQFLVGTFLVAVRSCGVNW
jgi:hypothetical protein